MARHSACLSPHPFCGDIQNAPSRIQLIAHVITQTSEMDGNFLVAIYLCRAVSRRSADDKKAPTPVEYALSLDYYDKTPDRKMAMSLVSDGTYFAHYGPILNPVEGDYSTGRLDQNEVRELYCDSEPSHTEWQYWDSELTAGQLVVPEYRCLQVADQWVILDVDRARGIAQQVASLKVADDPEHNFGIHSRPDSIYVHSDDGSEWSKVLNENLPRTFL